MGRHLTAFDLTPLEAELLAEAARLLDLLDGLRAGVERDGLVMRWGDGTRVNPAAVEARATRLALVRIVAALDLPADLDAAAGTTAEHVGKLRAL